MAKFEAPARFLTAGEVAELLHVSPKTISRYSNEGKLPYVRTLGGHRRYNPDVVAGVIARLGRSDGDA
jgi:excisionase family DNA binding protein